MAEAQVPGHRVGCQVNLRNIDSGFADFGIEFVQEYHLQPQFLIECVGCCLHYLVTERHYGREDEANFNAVYFTQAVPVNVPRVACIARKSLSTAVRHGQSHGQIAVESDINLGVLGKKVISSGRTYQTYSPPEGGLSGLSLGIPVTARMECMAIEQARTRSAELADIYASYADATLIELYRQTRVNLEPREVASLRGVCTLRSDHSLNIPALRIE